FGPGCGRDPGDLVVGHIGQASQHVFEIGVGINAPATAGFDDGVNNCSALAGIRVAHEEPVLFSKGSRTNGIFHQVVVDLNPTVTEINVQRSPLAQRVVNGDAHQAL